MQRLLLILISVFFLQKISNAQVSGISYTLSPSAEYTWWDEKAGIEDGLMLGGRFGFGFGQFFELRANYFRTLEGQTYFSDFGIDSFDEETFTPSDVKVTRWGGDVKANISRGNLRPYLTLGTGIQTIQLDTLESQATKQIYVNAGVGLVFSLADRYTLQVEAKNTSYRFNAGRNLLTDDDKSTLGVTDAVFDTERLNNWSVNASLQFYIGGRRPSEMSALDKAYFSSFSRGFSSLGGTIEPVVGKINFDEALPYRDAWLAGGNAGIDFGQYVGLRGFYWRALEDGEYSKFDDLAIYGGELRMKLNTNTGLVPYLMLGGGNIDVNDDYRGVEVVNSDSTQIFTRATEDKGFAMGGIGALIPLSRNVQIFGSARALLTTGVDSLQNIQSPDELQTSWMYSAGFKLSFGKKASPSTILDNTISKNVDAALAEQRAVNEQQTEDLKNEYEARILGLEQQLNEAIAAQDFERAAALKKEKDLNEQVVTELEARQVEAAQRRQRDAMIVETQSTYSPNMNMGSEIRLSPAEFEGLIEEIMENSAGYTTEFRPYVQEQMFSNNTDNTAQVLREQEVQRRLGELEKQIIDLGFRQENLEKTISQQLQKDLERFSNSLENALNKLNDKMDSNREEMIRMNNRINNLDDRSGNVEPTMEYENNSSDKIKLFEKKNKNKKMNDGEGFNPSSSANLKSDLPQNSPFRKISYNGMSGFVGFNLGGSNTANLGLRWHYLLGKKGNIEFMPESFFGLGSSNTFGISGNFLFPIKIEKINPIRPYIGAGVGLMQLEQDDNEAKLRGAYNIILGSYLNVWKGRLYIDFMGRNTFKNNQIVAGYRFPF